MPKPSHRTPRPELRELSGLARWPVRGVLTALGVAILAGGCGGPGPTRRPAGEAALSQAELEQRAAGHDPAALRELAYRELQEGRHASALEKVERALQREPESFDGHNLRGMVYAEMGRAQEAMKEFEKAAAIDPGRSVARFNLGRLLLSQNYPAAAAQVLVEAAGVDPKNARIALMAGDAWRQAGGTVDAKRWYRKTLELRPEEAAAHAGLGEVLATNGQYEEALAALTRARELGDTSPRTRGFLGLAGAALARTPEEAEAALAHLNAARTAGEAGSHLFYGLGRAAMALRDYPRAEQALKEGVQRHPRAADLHQALGDLFAVTGRPEPSRTARETAAQLVRDREREQLFVGAIAASPQDPAPYLAYVDWLLDQNERERALAFLRQARQRFPENEAFADRLVRAQKLSAPRRPEAAREAGR